MPAVHRPAASTAALTQASGFMVGSFPQTHIGRACAGPMNGEAKCLLVLMAGLAAGFRCAQRISGEVAATLLSALAAGFRRTLAIAGEVAAALATALAPGFGCELRV